VHAITRDTRDSVIHVIHRRTQRTDPIAHRLVGAVQVAKPPSELPDKRLTTSRAHRTGTLPSSTKMQRQLYLSRWTVHVGWHRHPILSSGRPKETPGVSFSTRKAEIPAAPLPGSPVLAMTRYRSLIPPVSLLIVIT
jgi:hypothetical protein